MYLSLDHGRPGVVDMEPFASGLGEPGPVFEIIGMTIFYEKFWVDHEIDRYDDCLYYDDMLWGKVSILDEYDGPLTQLEPQKCKAHQLRICTNVFHNLFSRPIKDVPKQFVQKKFHFKYDSWRHEKSHDWEWIVLEHEDSGS